METSKGAKRVSVVIPVYNNAESLHELANRLLESISALSGIDFEVIFIDDGSIDSSIHKLSEIVEHSSKNVNFSVIELEGNFGQLGALFAGYTHCSGDAVITMSADLQDPPELILELIKNWLSGKKLVIGLRAERSDSQISRFTSRAAYWILKSRHKNIPLGGFDFYLMSAEIKNYLLSMSGRFRFIPTELMRLEPQIAFVDYHRKARKHGKSGYSLIDRWQIFLTALVDTSYKWIQLFTLTGLSLALAGMLLMSSLIYGYLNDSAPFQGFTLITCLILLSAGLQIIILSLIGEYVWRTYDIARNKPLFVIRSIINSDINKNI